MTSHRLCLVSRLAGDRGAQHARRFGAGDLRDRPLIVRERIGSRDLVRAASTEARAVGVTRGMRRREAEARCPEAVCVDADEANEARTFEVVARAIEALHAARRARSSRSLRVPDPGSVALLRWRRRARGADPRPVSRPRSVPTATTCGSGSPTACSSPGSRPQRVRPSWPAGGSAEFVAPWPVSVLDDDDLASLLVRLGLPTLGDVAALAPDAVLARFGADGRRIHELARGIDPGPSVLVTPPPDLVERTELDPPAERVDVAAFAAKELAGSAARTARRTRARVHARARRGRDRARRTAHALLASRPFGARRRAHPRGARRAGALAARRVDHHRRDDRGYHQPDADPRRGRAGRRPPARILGWRSGRAPTGRSRARRGPGHARLRRGRRPPSCRAAALRPSRCGGFRGASRASPSSRWRSVREVAAWPGALPPPFPARVFDPPLPAELVDAQRRGDRGERPG